MKIKTRFAQILSVGTICIVLLTLTDCSQMGKRYIVVDVKSYPSDATVYALIDSKLGGTFTPQMLGTTPLESKTMYYAFGAPGTGGTRIGIRISKPGYQDFDVLFNEGECYSSVEEAQQDTKSILAELQLLGDSSKVDTLDNDKYRKVELKNYNFKVPISWEVGGSEEEKYMVQLLDLDPVNKVTTISTFGISEGAIVTVYELTVPVNESENYIDNLFELNTDKFRQGKSNGLVNEVIENTKLELGQFDALLIDWISSRGELNHSRQWILNSKKTGGTVAVVLVFCNNQSYDLAKQGVDRLVETIRVTNDAIDF